MSVKIPPEFVAEHLRRYRSDEIDKPLGAEDAPVVEPFLLDNAMASVVTRALEFNPYEFLSPRLIALIRTAVIQSETGGDVRKRKAKGPKVLSVVNVFLQLNETQRFILVPDTDKLFLARGSDTLILVVTISITPTREALVARQLRTRQLRVGGGLRFGYVFDDKTPAQLIKLNTPDEEADRRLFTQHYGKNAGARIYSLMANTEPTMFALLRAELAALERAPPKEKKREALADEAEEVEEEEDGDEEETDGISIEFTDDETDEDSVSLSGSGSVEIVAQDEESGLLASFSDDAAADQEEAVEDAALASFSQSDDGVSLGAPPPPPPPPPPSAAPRPPAPDLAPVNPQPRLLDELQWLRVVVQNRAFTYGGCASFFDTADKFHQKFKKRFEISTQHLPDSLVQGLRLSEPKAAFYYINEDELDSDNHEPTIGELCLSTPLDESEEPDWNFAAPAPPPPPPPPPPSSAVAPVHLASTVEEQTLLHNLFCVDIGALTIAELREYGVARFEALFDIWNNVRAAASGQLANQVRVTYPTIARHRREWLRLVDDDVRERENMVPVIGLLVLCLCAKFDKRLGDNLIFLESLFMGTEHGADEDEGAQEATKMHVAAIRQFWLETPNIFEDECGADPLDTSWNYLVATLSAIARQWMVELERVMGAVV